MGLLASILIKKKALIWTLDKRLGILAGKPNRAHRPRLHS